MSDKALILFLRISKHRMMDNYLPKIRHCLDKLNTEQLWGHELHEANSIGGILLHICEHLNRHIATYKHTVAVSAVGIENHFPDLKVSNELLVVKVEEVFHAWQRAVDELIQKQSHSADLFSIYHLVEHTSYHLGQIVDRVQRKTGKSFQFVQNGLNERSLRKIVVEVDDSFS